MTPSTFIYCIFWKTFYPNQIIRKEFNTVTYTGITLNIDRRMNEHLNNRGCVTTKRYIKMYGLPSEIRYISIGNLLSYEKTFKKYTQKKKLRISKNWLRWAG